MSRTAEYECHTDAAACEVLRMRIQHRYRDLCRRWPALQNPAPPAPVEPVPDDRSFADEWDELVTRWQSGEYTLPHVDDLTGLVGPVVAHGYCLDPLIPDGARLYFDPTKPAERADIAWLLESAEARQHRIETDAGNDPAFDATYLEPLKSGAACIHLLTECEGEYWHIDNGGGGSPLGHSVILGVVAHVEI